MGLFDDAAREGADQARAKKAEADAKADLETRTEQEQERLNYRHLPTLELYTCEARDALRRERVRPDQRHRGRDAPSGWSLALGGGREASHRLGVNGKFMVHLNSDSYSAGATISGPGPGWTPVGRYRHRPLRALLGGWPQKKQRGWMSSQWNGFWFDATLNQWMVSKWIDRREPRPVLDAIAEAVKRLASESTS